MVTDASILEVSMDDDGKSRMRLTRLGALASHPRDTTFIYHGNGDKQASQYCYIVNISSLSGVFPTMYMYLRLLLYTLPSTSY